MLGALLITTSLTAGAGGDERSNLQQLAPKRAEPRAKSSENELSNVDSSLPAAIEKSSALGESNGPSINSCGVREDNGSAGGASIKPVKAAGNGHLGNTERPLEEEEGLVHSVKELIRRFSAASLDAKNGQVILMDFVPVELRLLVLRYMSVYDYLRLSRVSKTRLWDLPLLRRTELERLKGGQFNDDSVFNPMYRRASDLMAEAGAAEQEVVQADLVQPLKELVVEVFAVLGGEMKELALSGYYRAIAFEERLSAEIWEALTVAIIKDFADGIATEEATVVMLKKILAAVAEKPLEAAEQQLEAAEQQLEAAAEQQLEKVFLAISSGLQKSRGQNEPTGRIDLMKVIWSLESSVLELWWKETPLMDLTKDLDHDYA